MRAALVGALVLASTGAAAADPALPRISFAGGFGTGGLTGDRDEDFSRGESISLHLGVRVTCGLHVIAGGDGLLFARFMPDPSLAQDHWSYNVGVRWAPLEERPSSSRLAAANFHVRASVGVAHLSRRPYSSFFADDRSGPWAPAVGLAVAWMPVRGGDLVLGFELGDVVAFHDAGRRHTFGFNLVIQLGPNRRNR